MNPPTDITQFLNDNSGWWAVLGLAIAIAGVWFGIVSASAARRAARASESDLLSYLKRAMHNLTDLQARSELWLDDDFRFEPQLVQPGTADNVVAPFDRVLSALRSGRSVRLLGAGGLGKSTFAWSLRRVSLDSEVTPIVEVLSARDWDDSGSREDGRGVSHWAADVMSRRYPGTGKEFLLRALSTMEIVIAIDGIDELPDRQRRGLLFAAANHMEKLPLLLIERRKTVDTEPDEPYATFDRCLEFEILPTDLQALENYLASATSWVDKPDAPLPERLTLALQSPLVLKAAKATWPSSRLPDSLLSAPEPEAWIYSSFFEARLNRLTDLRRRSSARRLLTLIGAGTLVGARGDSFVSLPPFYWAPWLSWALMLPLAFALGGAEFVPHFLIWLWLAVGLGLDVVRWYRLALRLAGRGWLFRVARNGGIELGLALSLVFAHFALAALEAATVGGMRVGPALARALHDASGATPGEAMRWLPIYMTAICMFVALSTVGDHRDDIVALVTPPTLQRRLRPWLLRAIFACVLLVQVRTSLPPAVWFVGYTALASLVTMSVSSLARWAYLRIPPWTLRRRVLGLLQMDLLLRTRDGVRLPHDDLAVALVGASLRSETRHWLLVSLLPSFSVVRSTRSRVYSRDPSVAAFLARTLGPRGDAETHRFRMTWETRAGGSLAAAERHATSLAHIPGWESTRAIRADIRCRRGKWSGSDRDIRYLVRHGDWRELYVGNRVARVLVLMGRMEDALDFLESWRTRVDSEIADYYSYLIARIELESPSPEARERGRARCFALISRGSSSSVYCHVALARTVWERSGSARSAWKTLSAARVYEYSDRPPLSYWILRTELALATRTRAESRDAALVLERAIDWSDPPLEQFEANVVVAIILGSTTARRECRVYAETGHRLSVSPQLATLLRATGGEDLAELLGANALASSTGTDSR